MQEVRNKLLNNKAVYMNLRVRDVVDCQMENENLKILNHFFGSLYFEIVFWFDLLQTLFVLCDWKNQIFNWMWSFSNEKQKYLLKELEGIFSCFSIYLKNNQFSYLFKRPLIDRLKGPKHTSTGRGQKRLKIKS